MGSVTNVSCLEDSRCLLMERGRGWGRSQEFEQKGVGAKRETLARALVFVPAIVQLLGESCVRVWCVFVCPRVVCGGGWGDHSKVDPPHLPQHFWVQVQLFGNPSVFDENFVSLHHQKPPPRTLEPPLQRQRRKHRGRSQHRCSLLLTPCLLGARRLLCSPRLASASGCG